MDAISKFLKYFEDMTIVKYKSRTMACIAGPILFVSFSLLVGGIIFVGFATEWDMGVRSDVVGRKFYEYYSAAAVSCFFGFLLLVLGKWGCQRGNDCSLGCGNVCGDIWKDECWVKVLLIVLPTIMFLSFTSFFVLFGLILDNIIKIPSLVLTIIGAVVEGILVLKQCCSNCFGDSNKDDEESSSDKEKKEKPRCCLLGPMRVLASLTDLVMFIFWTIKLAAPSSGLNWLLIGFLRIGSSVVGTVADIIQSCNCSKIFFNIWVAAGMITQSVLMPLRAEGQIDLHYAYCIAPLSMGFGLLAIVLLFAGCCGYSIGSDEDNDNTSEGTKDVEMGNGQ